MKKLCLILAAVLLIGMTAVTNAEVTEKPAYTVSEIEYDGTLATGKVNHVESTPELEKVYVRVTFFLANGDCAIQIKAVDELDGSFLAGAMGDFVHISVIVMDVNNAYKVRQAMEHAYGNGGIELELD